MSTRVPEDGVRVRPIRGHWAAALPLWLAARPKAWAAGLAAVLVAGALWWGLREKPRPGAGGPPRESQIASMQERLKTDPEDIAALVELGTLLFEKGKEHYLEAINALEQARDLGALDPRIFYCLGVMYQEEGLIPFALTEYKRFLRHYPEDKEVRLLAAKLYYRLGMFSEAVGEYERLKFQSPDDPIVEENLGLSLWGAKLVDRAAASFEQLKGHGGDFARRAEFYLGQLDLEAGRFEAAAGKLGRAASGAELPGLEPGKLHAALGLALSKTGKWLEAEAAWKSAVAAAPGDAKAAAALREASRRASALRREAERKAAAERREADRKAREERRAREAAERKARGR